MIQNGVDLHAHTTASDGSLSPSQLVALAHERGLEAIAITDHDTVAGWDEALQTGAQLGVEVVPGVELSTADATGRYDLLGYYIRGDSRLVQTLREIQAARADRNTIIFRNLAELGVPLDEAEVRALAGEEGVVGRPHFARAMVARGYVKSTQEAFDRFLADNGPAYATKKVLSPQDAIAAIRDAGGVAVWAHPLGGKTAARPRAELETLLRGWKELGLEGLEAWYPTYSGEQAAWASRMAQTYGLIASGGSDYHGVSKPDIQLGVTHTGGPVPRVVLEQIQARRDTLRSE